MYCVTVYQCNLNTSLLASPLGSFVPVCNRIIIVVFFVTILILNIYLKKYIGKWQVITCRRVLRPRVAELCFWCMRGCVLVFVTCRASAVCDVTPEACQQHPDHSLETI